MIIVDVIQGSPEWIQARIGIPTASNFDKIVTAIGTRSKQYQKYMYQLAAECITKTKEESFQNFNMQRGIELESEAISMYEVVTGNKVKTVGLCLNDEAGSYGCSPDGFIGEDGLVEIKCPTSSIHVGYLLNNALPSEYFQQVQGQLFITGRKRVDFFSFYPGLKPLLVKVKPDKEFLKLLEIELKCFCKELKEITKKIKEI